MPQLLLFSSANDQGLVPDDFGVEVTETGLSVPPRLFAILRGLSIQTAEEFVGYVGAFPGGIAASLNWNIASVLRAHTSLVEKLKGHISDSILFPKVHPRRNYGALHPQRHPQ